MEISPLSVDAISLQSLRLVNSVTSHSGGACVHESSVAGTRVFSSRGPSRDTRECTPPPAGCISMYFYARVIAPTVYFYPDRVICNVPRRTRDNPDEEGRLFALLASCNCKNCVALTRYYISSLMLHFDRRRRILAGV